MATNDELTRTINIAPTPRVDPASRAPQLIDHPLLAVAQVEGGRVGASNRAWKRLFALPEGVSVDSHVASLFPSAAGADRFERTLLSRLSDVNGEPVHAIAEVSLTRRNATSFIAEVIVLPTGPFDKDHLLSADATWQVRDVSEERTLRQDLRELDDYHRELTRDQRELTFVIDRKGRLSYVGSSIEALLGYRVEALLGEPFVKLFDSGQRVDFANWVKGVTPDAKQEDTKPYRLVVVAADGSKRSLACRSRNCFAMPAIAGMIVHALDVTDGAKATDAGGDEEPTFGHDASDSALRARLAALARSSATADEHRVTTLLQEACAGTEARVAVLWACDKKGAWSESQVARPTVDAFRSSGPDRVPPLVSGSLPSSSTPSEAGESAVAPIFATFVSALIIDDIATDPAASTARGELEACGVGAVIEVPVFVDGVLVACLAIGSATTRHWAAAEIDFVSSLALLMASALASRADPSTGDPSVPVDILTGLPGRVGAAKLLDARVAAATETNEPLVALVVDLDRFRDLNDRLGHVVGDAVLQRVAMLLGSLAGADDFVARIGDDQFLVVLRDPSGSALDGVLQDLLKRLGDIDECQPLPRIEASIGVARLSAEFADGESLWRMAELAAREAKARGRGQAVQFQPRLSAAVAARKVLGDEIEEAMELKQFALFYQPQIGLATGRMIGLEAFLRWQHPVRGVLLPDVFMDAAIDRGLTELITRMVFGHVCDQVVAWQQVEGFPDVPVSVNISGRQFNDRRLPAIVASALMRSGLPARKLMLEVIEQNFLFDAGAMERVVSELTRLGVRISIGSFGLGHATLQSARQLGVGQVKISRGFVEGLPDDAESTIVVRAAIEIARRLKCQVIAEGVETRAQFECLRSLGCEAAQGFYFGAPLSADEILSFVASNREQPVY